MAATTPVRTAGGQRLDLWVPGLSLVGSTFYGRVTARGTEYGRPTVMPAVIGTAYGIGTCEFTVDPRDLMTPRSVLR